MKLVRTERRAEAQQGVLPAQEHHDAAPVLDHPEFIPVEGKHYTVDENGCWLWARYINPGGYGSANWGWKAHRLVYANMVEPVRKGWHVHHLCEQKACVNPNHLHQKHPSWHLRDHTIERRRVLTMDEARVIRRRLRTEPQTTFDDLAAEYGCSRGHVQDIGEGVAFWEPGVEWVKPERPCIYCGDTIPQERRRHAQYCKEACRVAMNRKRADERDPGWRTRYQRERRAKLRAERKAA